MTQSYQTFREYVAFKTLKISNGILQEALYPKILVPYPLDYKLAKIRTWAQIKATVQLVKTDDGQSFDSMSYATSEGKNKKVAEESQSIKDLILKTALFESYFKRQINLRSGKNGDINIARFYFMYPNPD